MAKATTKGRVHVPRAAKDGFELAAKIYKQHLADGAKSELHNLDGMNWDVVGPTIVQGQEHHEEAERLKGLMEERYRLRDAAFAPVDEIVRASATYLKGKYAKIPKKLANWGFEVDDTPKAKPAKKAKE